MAERDFGDYFITDADDDIVEEDEDVMPPAVVPAPAAPAPSPTVATPASPVTASADDSQAPPSAPAPAPVASPPANVPEASEQTPAVVSAPPEVIATPPSAPVEESREARLARALNDLMVDNVDIQAAALVSLDGFTMASALPEGMHEDRVGAMSAAILGLGERAAAELGRGALSQVFIEGDGGYVVLIAAGTRAVLTALADQEAKLGLVLYDMRNASDSIGVILG